MKTLITLLTLSTVNAADWREMTPAEIYAKLDLDQSLRTISTIDEENRLQDSHPHLFQEYETRAISPRTLQKRAMYGLTKKEKNPCFMRSRSLPTLSEDSDD